MSGHNASSVQPDRREAAANARRPEVLFALTASEREQFFPRGFGALGARALWLGTDRLPAEEWAGVLRDKSLRVLVTCWATPAVDLENTAAGGGPVEYVCHVAGSVRRVVPRPAIANGLKVTNWGGLVAEQVAEHALLLILAQARNLPAWRDYIVRPRTGPEKSGLATRTLRGRRVAIHGFGAIARELIRLLRPFGVELSVYSQGLPAARIAEPGIRAVESLEELAAGAEVFVCCEALTAATRGSITAGVLARLSPGAIFVNVARGALVDEAALLEAARRHDLRVACDVFCQEPVSAESPFFELPEVLMSPHIAGPTHDSYALCGEHALANIDRFFRGETLLSPVTLEIFDRST